MKQIQFTSATQHKNKQFSQLTIKLLLLAIYFVVIHFITTSQHTAKSWGEYLMLNYNYTELEYAANEKTPC